MSSRVWLSGRRSSSSFRKCSISALVNCALRGRRLTVKRWGGDMNCEGALVMNWDCEVASGLNWEGG